jgi:hypothetical protein
MYITLEKENKINNKGKSKLQAHEEVQNLKYINICHES